MKTTIAIPVRKKSIAKMWANTLSNLSIGTTCSAVPVLRKNSNYVSFTFDSVESLRRVKVSLNSFVVFNPAFRPLKYQLQKALVFAKRYPEKCEH